MFKKILVALDADEDCNALFARALALAQITGAQLRLLGVLYPDSDATLLYPGLASYPATGYEAPYRFPQDVYQEYKDKGFKLLSRLRDLAISTGVQAEFAQPIGSPGRVICDDAKAEGVDLIMVGSHGRRGLEEVLAGSVSSYVMHRAPCSVMVVHAKQLAPKTDAQIADMVTAQG